MCIERMNACGCRPVRMKPLWEGSSAMILTVGYSGIQLESPSQMTICLMGHMILMTKFSRTQTPRQNTPTMVYVPSPPRVFQEPACSLLSTTCHSTAFFPRQFHLDPPRNPPAHPPPSLQQITLSEPSLCSLRVSFKKVHSLFLRKSHLHSKHW